MIFSILLIIVFYGIPKLIKNRTGIIFWINSHNPFRKRHRKVIGNFLNFEFANVTIKDDHYGWVDILSRINPNELICTYNNEWDNLLISEDTLDGIIKMTGIKKNQGSFYLKSYFNEKLKFALPISNNTKVFIYKRTRGGSIPFQ